MRLWRPSVAMTLIGLPAFAVGALSAPKPPPAAPVQPVAVYEMIRSTSGIDCTGRLPCDREGGIDYGVDNAEPFYDPFDDPKDLSKVLDEFLDKRGEDRERSDLKRALLLNDLWAAFDLAASPQGSPTGAAVRGRLARVIGRMAMTRAAIVSLPNNYAQAVKSGQFAVDFDPEHPERPFLPPDLFDTTGPWVEIGEEALGAVAPFHVELLDGRFRLQSLIRCPGGREATLSYLETLTYFPLLGRSIPRILVLGTRTTPRCECVRCLSIRRLHNSRRDDRRTCAADDGDQ